MLGSIRIGTVFGIHVRVHWLFVALVLFLTLWDRENAATTLLWIGTLFGVVFLHELGHSLMARRFGIRVLDITFWPLGGMARMSEIPEDSKVEGLIAIAGPAVNFALAFLSAPFLIWSLLAESTPLSEAVFGASGFFLAVNLMLGVFNLVPAFPMDGGRVLRAFLGRNGDWVGATETAVKVGKVFAAGMVIFGLAMGRGLNFLPLIGVFVWFAGSRELQAVRMRHAPAYANPLARMFSPFATAAGAPPAPPPPRAAAAEPVRHEPEPSPDPSGARRPSVPGDFGRRLSEQDIERLERYRGRLDRFGDQ